MRLAARAGGSAAARLAGIAAGSPAGRRDALVTMHSLTHTHTVAREDAAHDEALSLLAVGVALRSTHPTRTAGVFKAKPPCVAAHTKHCTTLFFLFFQTKKKTHPGSFGTSAGEPPARVTTPS